MALLPFFSLLLLTVTLSLADEGILDCLTGPCVTVPNVGKIQGSKKSTQFTGRDVYGFWGIPFAEDTGGANRFKPPRPRMPLNDGNDAYDASFTRWLTGWWNRMCPQPGVSLPGSFMSIVDQMFPIDRSLAPETKAMMGSEDCLHLAVFTPELPSAQHGNPKLPVMFFIHGGGFMQGGYIGSGPKKLLERDVVLVEVQYRVGPLGFFCLPDDDIAGNMGLLDQLMGLDWVRQNIEHFGGDPERVTIFGESAGAASVSYHMISPLSHDYFDQAIAESGSALASWALDLEPERHAREIAQRFGCDNKDIASLKNCMQQKSATEIVDSHKEYYLNERANGRLGFGGSSPCVQTHGDEGKRFITKHPKMYMTHNSLLSPKPAIFGANKHEGSFVLGLIYNRFITPNNYQNDAMFLKHLFSNTLLEAMGLHDDSGVVYELLNYAFFNTSDLGDWDKMMPGMINLVGTFFIKSATYEAMKYNSLNDVDSYFYSFEYEGENSLWNLLFALEQPPIPRGVTHGDELIYLFSTDIWVFNDQDWDISWNMINLWANFATYGNPIHSDHPLADIPQWPKWTDDNLQYLKIDVESSVRRDYVRTWSNPDADTR